jgi:hypothetical protein
LLLLLLELMRRNDDGALCFPTTLLQTCDRFIRASVNTSLSDHPSPGPNQHN